MSTIDLVNGSYTDIPNDKVAYVVTHLEMREKPTFQVSQPDGVSIETWNHPDSEAYLTLFREIGEDWLWSSRLRMSRANLDARLKSKAVEIFVPVVDGRRCGLLEMDFTAPYDAEISYFGLVPDAIGKGVGRYLMSHGLQYMWAKDGIRRVWLHTCTGDSPQAMGFYRSCGFVPFKRGIEVVQDPRHAGLIPSAKGSHIAFLE